MVLVKSGLNREQVSLMRLICIENCVFVLKEVVLIVRVVFNFEWSLYRNFTVYYSLISLSFKTLFIIIFYSSTLCLKLKVTRFGRATFSYSAVQPSIDINLTWWLGYIRKLAFGSPWGNYFTPGFVYSQHTAPKNNKLAQTPPS